MEVSLNQTFEDSQMAADNYLAYISRQNDEQKGQVNNLSNLLDSVIEGVNAMGTVAAMAAKESMVSHNTIFGMLKAMNTQQGLTAQMITELRQNGGVGGGSGGGMLEGAGMAGGLSAVAGPVLGIATENPLMLIPLAIGALLGGVKESDQETARRREQTHPNSLTNKALEASAEAEKLVNQAYYSLNPAPNPLMNGPGMVQDGVDFKDIPFVHTAKEAYAIVMAINEADRYLEATGQRTPLYAGLDMEYYDTPDSSNFFVNGIIEQQPQSVQVVTQPASTSVAPEQTIILIFKTILMVIGKTVGGLKISGNISPNRLRAD